jgi:iron complex outermembrane receptor protein
VHSSTNLTKDIRLALGLDNIADTDYAEHLSRAGSAVEGYPAIDKVSEPGRTWWAKLSYSF